MTFRVIARLDVKPPWLVKGVHLEGLRKLGEPRDFAMEYYRQGADEINYHDVVASLYGRNSIGGLVSTTAEKVFVPITVGGGIRSAADASGIVRQGGDKVSINTAAIHDVRVIREIADVLGCQAVVLGVEAKSLKGAWTVMTDAGREKTGRDVVEWVAEAEARGAGEILLTSIDQEGTRGGIDVALVSAVRAATALPVIAHGGAAGPDDAVRAFDAGADAIAVASVLHNGQYRIADFKQALARRGIEVRS